VTASFTLKQKKEKEATDATVVESVATGLAIEIKKSGSLKVKTFFGEKSAQSMSVPFNIIKSIFPAKFSKTHFSIY
jgi:hypothetical protein